MLATSSWTSEFPELWQISVCFLNHLVWMHFFFLLVFLRSFSIPQPADLLINSFRGFCLFVLYSLINWRLWSLLWFLQYFSDLLLRILCSMRPSHSEEHLQTIVGLPSLLDFATLRSFLHHLCTCSNLWVYPAPALGLEDIPCHLLPWMRSVWA